MDAKEGSMNFAVGLLVGAASIPPGISGGLVAVLFGIYERLIDDINHIRTKIKEDLGFILTVGFGIIAGIFLMVFVTRYAMDTYLMPTMFLFVGLIIGQLPSLVKITRRGDPTKPSHIVWLAIGIAVMVCLLILELRTGDTESGAKTIDDSGLLVGAALSLLAGAILAVSKIIPGISGSTVLLALGLYKWMLDIIADFDLINLIPFGIGFVIAVFAFAKVMGHILKNHHHAVYYFITGLTVGSIALILAITEVNGMNDVLVGCAAAAVGVVISMALSLAKRPKESV
jgi:putative membrane protein